MQVRFLIRFILLAIGFCLTTVGLLAWQKLHFDMSTIWPIAEEFTIHPIHAMVFGLALIPPTLWEIFVLENKDQRDHQ